MAYTYRSVDEKHGLTNIFRALVALAREARTTGSLDTLYTLDTLDTLDTVAHSKLGLSLEELVDEAVAMDMCESTAAGLEVAYREETLEQYIDCLVRTLL